MLDLTDQVVIVTGAGSGIGARLARLLSRAGARVCLNARRRDRLQQVADRCPGPTLVAVADLTEAAARDRLVHRTLDHWGTIDMLVNNAGLGAYGHFLETDETLWRRIFEINLFAPVLLTRRVLPIMLAQGSGTIVNLASIGGLLAHSDRVSPYVASKHALVGFSRALARDLEPTGIRVLAVCPHLTDTEFFATSPGAAQMAPVLEGLKPFLDSPEAVAEGIVAALDSQRLIVFPTDKPARAYQRGRDV